MTVQFGKRLKNNFICVITIPGNIPPNNIECAAQVAMLEGIKRVPGIPSPKSFAVWFWLWLP